MLQWKSNNSTCVCHTLFNKLHSFRKRRLFNGICPKHC